MLPVLTAAETRGLDEATQARGTPVDLLMERAGLAVARAARSLAGGAYGRRAVVVCGKGNNGGDGLVAARHLARWGMGLDVFLLEPELREPAAGKRSALRRAGVAARGFDPVAIGRALARADVVIDAIFGIGFHGAAEGPVAEAIEALNRTPAPVVSVDIPSGIEGDTGAVRGPAVQADATVTFGAPKLGTILFPGAAAIGVLEVADIGFPPDLLTGEIGLLEDADVRPVWPARPPETTKRRSGVVLVVAGSRRMTGAPRLVAAGAARAGAGLVTVAAPESALVPIQSSLDEATFLPLAESQGAAADAAWEALSGRLEGFGAVAVGPGLSTDGEAPSLARRLVRESPVPLVIDADALNAFAGRAGELSRRAAPAILTPHVGEFARLFGMSAEAVEEDRVGLARKAAAETDCVVLLKGSRSVIASPEGEVRINPTGGPFLATGGTGDVLTGIVAALLARGVAPLDAASASAYVHGLAGRIAGGRTGEGTVAGDVARAVPAAVRRITEGR